MVFGNLIIFVFVVFFLFFCYDGCYHFLFCDATDREFIKIMLEKGLHPGFKDITRSLIIDCNRKSCINNLYIQSNKIKYKTYTSTIAFNDHCPIFMTIKSIKIKQKNTNDTYISYRKL